MNRTLPALLLGASLFAFFGAPAAAAGPIPVVHPAADPLPVAPPKAPADGRASAARMAATGSHPAPQEAAAASAAQPLPWPPGTGPKPRQDGGDSSGLVPGITLPEPFRGQQEQQQLPDQALPPNIPHGHAARGPEPKRPTEPVRHIELVPPSEVQGEHAATPRCSKSTGPAQRAVEEYLEREADGRQSAGDCDAIRAFQRERHIEPATGFAGPVTGAVVRLLQAQKDPNRDGKCPNRNERVVCVDLSRQIVWVQQDGEVLFQPVPMRSGRPAMATRTGTYQIYWRNKNHTSSLYHTPMPFAQFFDGGEALHGVYDDVYAGSGSHGCINLSWADAQKLWNVLQKNDIVHVWGRKTGV
ncbi:L,D-transpeptidase family protein [Streptomyces sp. NPDC053427]|uniref:L,D-transpeptidase family protein n=1 Tax=Streptomyces sp. NPDC053427 TaxID=3365701 RepID=UPI0037CE9967